NTTGSTYPAVRNTDRWPAMTRIPPTTNAAAMALANVLVERRPSDLKLGYRTVLTIMADRKIRTINGTYFHRPSDFSCSFKLMINNVSEATSPAADGMGNPRNSLPPPAPGTMARQLNRARRNAPHNR